MNDRDLMENLLLTTKGAADMYLHGVIEASDVNVRNAFDCALDKTLKMQNEIYQKMSMKGWYQNQPVEQQKIDTTKNKFVSMQ